MTEKRVPVPQIPDNRRMEEFALKTVLNQFFISWNKDEGVRDGWVHASSILENKNFCFREHVLAINHKKETKKIGIETLQAFLHGWLLHEKWQDVLSQAASSGMQATWEDMFNEAVRRAENDPSLLSLLQERHEDLVIRQKWEWLFQKYGKLADEAECTHLERKWDLSFTPDLILKMVIPAFIAEIKGEQYVMEIKGYKSETYEHMLSYDDPMKDASFRAATTQANLYMYMLGLKKSVILIENKDTQRYFIRIRDYDEALALPYIERLQTLKELTTHYKKTGQFPKRICETAEDTRANSCPLRDACFAKKEERERYRKDQ